MYLENDSIKLRALEEEDVDLLYRWENNTDLWIHGNTLSPYSRLAIREYIRTSLESDIYQNKQLRLMIILKEHNEVIGTIDLYEFDAHHQRAGVGILIDTPFRHMNYACQTLLLLDQYAFDFLHLHQLYAYISLKNENSIALFKKAGYIAVASLKDWIRGETNYEDVLFLQKTKSNTIK